MKFNEDVLKKINLEPESVKEPVNIMEVSEMLAYLKECAERIYGKSDKYVQTADADIQLDCIDIVTAKLNDFVQVFKDLVIFYRKVLEFLRERNPYS